jgi:glycerol-3-phosphate acyltransferase PlsX
MRIALDAMGGDHAPHEIVAGAVRAANDLTDLSELILVGDESAIQAELNKAGPISPKIRILHASEVIDMDESPAQAIRRKKDSSISRAVEQVKDQKADAVVSAGHTGAMVVAASLKLRTLEGIDRPAIAIILPTRKKPMILLDAGANPDATPEMLAQFAVMGTIYSKVICHTESPSVGLLSIGDEDNKGNEFTKAAFKLLSAAPINFRGNVEGHDLFEGETDVVVCDGFVGNVVLKTSESLASAIFHWLRTEFKANPIRTLGALIGQGAFKALKQKLDQESYGGALLLGVNGVCIITHGSSSANAIYHAIRVACESLEYKLNHLIVDEISRFHTMAES